MDKIRIEEMFSQLKSFFNTGQTKDYHYRVNQLKSLLNGILENEDDINQALYQDLNKSSYEAYLTEVGIVIGEIKYFLKHLKGWMGKKRVKTSIGQMPAKQYIYPEPYGVVLIMSPWNYPFQLTINPLIAAIAAGNTILVKPSNYSPNTSKIMKDICEKYLDNNLVKFVEGGRNENQALLDQPFNYIFFTGSPTVGRVVMEKASRNLTPITLELGGKSPCIVDKNINLEKAAKRIVFGKFTNAGQTCIAPDYLLVHQDIKNDFIQALINQINLAFDDETYFKNSFPKIINQKHFDRLIGLMKNEKIIFGGIYNENTFQINPTLLDNPGWNSPVMSEEIFGPILPIIDFNDYDFVIDKIKSLPNPLALYIFSNDKKIQNRFINEINYGGGCVNDCLLHIISPHAPFGGIGESGMGSYHGKKSFETFTHYKTVWKKKLGLDVSVKYHPYTDKKEKVVRKIL